MLAALCGLAAGCSSGATPAAEPPSRLAPGATTGAGGVGGNAVRTDRETYQVERMATLGEGWYRVRIPYVFVNRTGTTVYLDPCVRAVVALQARGALGGWGRARWSGDCAGAGVPPIRVAPGAERADTAAITGVAGAQGGPEWPAPDLPGSYRLLLPAYARWTPEPGGRAGPGRLDEASLLPESARGSNAFTLLAAPAAR